MFDKKDVMKKLGVVSVSALMLLGVGAGISNASTSVHADDIVAESNAQGNRYAIIAAGGNKVAAKAYAQKSEAYDKAAEDGDYKKAEEILSADDSDNNTSDTMHIAHHKHVSNPAAKKSHKTVNAVKHHVRHHVIKRSLSHDVIYVNRVNRKRHARKNIAKRVHNVKRQARRTRKGSNCANLQHEIRSLKRQLKRVRSWRTRRSIRRQLNKLNKRYTNKRANKKNRKLNKHYYRHVRKHANKRNHKHYSYRK